MLFEQVIQDNKKTTQKVEEVHAEVSILKSDFQVVKSEVSRILSIVERPSWWSRFWEQYGSKIVLSIFFLTASLFCKFAIPELIDLWEALSK